MPEAVICFLESDSFEDAIRNAISLGGDTDTLAAIPDSIAEGFYSIPDDISQKTMSLIDDDLQGVVVEFYQKYMNTRLEQVEHVPASAKVEIEVHKYYTTPKKRSWFSMLFG